jgi:hypothetical protein
MYPAFADLRVIQGAVISVEKGLDPRVSNLGDHWARPFDYPMLWVSIGKALNFTNETRFIFICSAMVFCFIGICAFLIFRFPSFGLLASMVSTATLLGIERGNTDLLIFLSPVPGCKRLSDRAGGGCHCDTPREARCGRVLRLARAVSPKAASVSGRHPRGKRR